MKHSLSLKGTVSWYGSHAFVHYFTASEIIIIRTVAKIYETQKQAVEEMVCKTKVGHARELK